ncbi:MAG TPA: hypothetical protein VMU95_39835 [Trebonia sp.]|nr:hypothetical protein [Trebonia sp.]
MELDDEGPDPNLCNRCLVTLNVTWILCAQWPDNLETCPRLDPAGAKRWAQQRLYGDRATFQGPNGDAGYMIAVSTWHGDPVCAQHLAHLVGAEAKIPR